MKEKGISKSIKAAVIVVIVAVAGIGAYFLMEPGVEEKPGEEGGEAENQESEMGFEWFQTGNTLSITQLQTKQSGELENNRIGDGISLHPQIQTEDPDHFANRISEKGLKWMKFSLDVGWPEVESMGAYSEYHIYPEQDRAVTGLANNGVKTMCMLMFWDEEITEFGENYSRFKTEDEIQRYLDYVQFVVHHFKDRVEYYEILNEPNANHEGRSQRYVELADYINLVKRTVPVIRQECPEAKIVAGAITPLLYYDHVENIARFDPVAREYLFGILESDVMPLVDAFSWHALGGASPEYAEEYYYAYPSIVQEIKDVASAHGFNGEYIGAELLWQTSLHNPGEGIEYSETAAAKYLARGIITNLGLDATAGLCECLECQPKMSVIQGLCTVMAGANPISLPVEIQSEAENIRNYSFSLSSGDKLIALWTDGVAVDDDPGVMANLTCQGFTAQDVTGIDVLMGYQQSIITSNESGNLVIQNLIVRDYPLILQITVTPTPTPAEGIPIVYVVVGVIAIAVVIGLVFALKRR